MSAAGPRPRSEAVRLVVLCETGLLVKGDVHPAVVDALEGPVDPSRWLVLERVVATNPAGGSTEAAQLHVAMAHIVSWRLARTNVPDDSS